MDKKEELNSQETPNTEEKPKYKPIIEAADSLSLGISMVVAVVMGVGIGYLLKSMTGIAWMLWVGVFIGIAAAFLNVFKVYVKQKEMYNDLANEPRYAIKNKLNDDDDEDECEKNY